MEESIVFKLNVYDIPEKNNVNHYIETLKKKFDSTNLKYSIKENNGYGNKDSQEISFRSVKNMEKSVFNNFLSSIGKREEISKEKGVLSIDIVVSDMKLYMLTNSEVQDLNNWLAEESIKSN